MSHVDCVVIGAGVVGLALARALALGGREVIIVEAERQVGQHTSSRNSEVIHAGIHYPPGSLKARLCVEGRERLYEYCALRGIEHRRCGKLTIASREPQLPQLVALEANARASGVLNLEWLDRDAALRLEPEISCVAALYSPSTGIIDSQGYLQALLADAQERGASIVYGARVTALRAEAAGVQVFIDGDSAPAAHAGLVFNCAGLHAAQVAATVMGLEPRFIPGIHYAKGNYFALAGRSPFSHLIYPAPPAVGDSHLGIHMTLDLRGGARFGPDLEWVDDWDYRVDPARAPLFCEAIHDYWPALRLEQLVPSYAGVRPRLAARGEPAKDFYISGPAEHGVPGIVNVFGIESPGLTASLALADWIAGIAD